MYSHYQCCFWKCAHPWRDKFSCSGSRRLYGPSNLQLNLKQAIIYPVTPVGIITLIIWTQGMLWGLGSAVWQEELPPWHGRASNMKNVCVPEEGAQHKKCLFKVKEHVLHEDKCLKINCGCSNAGNAFGVPRSNAALVAFLKKSRLCNINNTLTVYNVSTPCARICHVETLHQTFLINLQD